MENIFGNSLTFAYLEGQEDEVDILNNPTHPHQEPTYQFPPPDIKEDHKKP